jgi:hypothetical protein
VRLTAYCTMPCPPKMGHHARGPVSMR